VSTRPQDVVELVPPAFLESVGRFTAEQGRVGGPSGAQWAATLPRLLAETLDAWHLVPLAAGFTGWTAVVVPVRRGGERHVLKVVWPHIEGRDEALALRHWDGRGAVRLVAADPSRGALLLEPLDATRDLTSVDIDTACEVIGALLGELHVPAPPQLRTLSSYLRHHTANLLASDAVLPRRMVDRTAGLLDDLLADPACDATLLHTDLHYENVLASLPGTGRPDWLAIDPHALAGHPGFELQPLLRNRTDELGTGSTFRWHVRRRLEIACEAAGVDEDEALAWTYVQSAVEAGWAAEDGNGEGVTFNVALMKALDG
jgi:streptomycin 6-kinase